MRPIRSKTKLAKEKDKRKEIARKKKGGEEKKKAMVFYIGNSFKRTKKCWREEVFLAVTFSKIQLDIMYNLLSMCCPAVFIKCQEKLFF